MWIQVRTMDGKETHRIDSLSKLTKVDELRLKILELFKVDPEKQRLFYRGKQVGQTDTFLFNSVTTVLLGSLVIMSELICSLSGPRWRTATQSLTTTLV